MVNPFIPLKDADTVIIAGNTNEDIYKNLKNRGVRVIKTIAHKKVHSSINFHPDIVLHPISHDNIIVEPSVFEYYKDAFENTNIKIIKGEKELDCKYPLDIAYNVGRIGRFAVHNFKYTDDVLKYYLQKQGLELINVNQGYTKCSMAIVGQNDIITSDVYMHSILTMKGINCLLINSGYIFLKNQNYGFIGGCTGSISDKEVLLSGNLNKHPNKKEIKSFIYSLNKNVIYLSMEKISDIGTIISLNCN